MKKFIFDRPFLFAADHARTYRGKPWKYVLIPHDAIMENMSIAGLAGQFINT